MVRASFNIAAIALVLCLGFTAAAHADEIVFFTAVGGASGMTTQLNPFASEKVVRGAAPQIMDSALCKAVGLPFQPPVTGVNYAYSSARMQAYKRVGGAWVRDDDLSEPRKKLPDGSGVSDFVSGAVQFTGDQSPCEVQYVRNGNKLYYAMVLRSDSVIGQRWVVNRQRIYDFVTLKSGNPVWVNQAGAAMAYAGDWQLVLDDINARLASQGTETVPPGIAIEGGLSECYLDSGIKAIDKYNAIWPNTIVGGKGQPQLNLANVQNTKNNDLAIAVMAVIYNEYVQNNWGNNNQPINLTSQMLRLLTGGKIDYWDYFFPGCSGETASRKQIFNYFREPLSGTGVTYLYQVMRSVETSANGSEMSEYYDFGDTNMQSAGWHTVASCSDGTNHHRSGIPGLTCVPSPYPVKKSGSSWVYDSAGECLDYKPGSGAVNKAVNLMYGGIGYTFLQKFTNPNQSQADLQLAMGHIRVAKINGYSPYPFDLGNNLGDENSLPGINGARDVTDPPTGSSFYQAVIDGRYPLWTYNHCFDATNGESASLQDFLALWTNTDFDSVVRGVGLLPLGDMTGSFVSYRTKPTSGPNANRGKGLGRCGFVSPITGEIVRDGMMMMPVDDTQPDGLPGEAYPEMRP